LTSAVKCIIISSKSAIECIFQPRGKHKKEKESDFLNNTKFYQLLKEADLQMSQVARRVGVSREAVRLWANGKNYPSADKLWAIAKALNVSVERVVNCFGEDDD
jgi:DNA-binding XRE family transcriptional regulator